MSKWYEVFITGNYPQGSFSESYLDKVIANFKRDKKAGIPITLDHNRTGPAYGWVENIKRVGKKIYASFSDVVSELKDAVAEKRYKNVSVSFHPIEPRLLEVSFLGARLPQIKGLTSPAFSLPDDLICIEFGEDTDSRIDDDDELLEDDYDPDDDDIERYKTVISYQNEKILELETQLADVKANPEFYEQVESSMTEREKEFAEETAKYKAMFEDSQRQSKEKEINEFCADCLREGYFLPRILPHVKALMFSLAGTDEAIEFSTHFSVKGTPLELLKQVLSDGKPQYAYMNTEIVTDTPNRRYDFSESRDLPAIEFSKGRKIAIERGLNPNDPAKMAEIFKEIANKSQKNTIDFGGNK